MATQAPDRARVTESATHVRYWVIVFAVTLAVITYIDRVAMSFAAPSVSRDLGLSKQQMGAAFSAFLAFYSLFEIPSGFLGDRLGPRRVLDADRHLVVVVHRIDRRDLELCFATLHAVAFRRGRGGLLSEHNESLHYLAAALRTGTSAGDHVAGGAMGRRVHAAAGFSHFQGNDVAPGVRGIWRYRSGLGHIFLPVVPGRSARQPQDQRRRTRIAGGESSARGQPRKRAVGQVCPVANGVDAVRAIFLSLLRMVLLHHLAADISPGIARSGHREECAAECAAAVFGRTGSLTCGLISGPVTRLTNSVARTRKLMAYLGFTGASLLADRIGSYGKSSGGYGGDGIREFLQRSGNARLVGRVYGRGWQVRRPNECPTKMYGGFKCNFSQDKY